MSADEVGAGTSLRTSYDGRVARITLDRPEAINAISLEMALALKQAIEHASTHADAVIVGASGDHFCAGADLKNLDDLGGDADAMRDVIGAISRAFAAAERAPIPVIAAVRGYALAGGFEFMQACDLVVVAEDAVIGDQHANFGLVPGGGGSQRLPRLCGRQRALGLLLTGDRISGVRAVEMGLAYKAVPAAEVDAEADALARRLAAKSRAGLSVIKSLVSRGALVTLDVALEMEITANVAHASHPDFHEGMSAFRERRAPDFGTPPDDVAGG